MKSQLSISKRWIYMLRSKLSIHRDKNLLKSIKLRILWLHQLSPNRQLRISLNSHLKTHFRIRSMSWRKSWRLWVAKKAREFSSKSQILLMRKTDLQERFKSLTTRLRSVRPKSKDWTNRPTKLQSRIRSSVKTLIEMSIGFSKRILPRSLWRNTITNPVQCNR